MRKLIVIASAMLMILSVSVLAARPSVALDSIAGGNLKAGDAWYYDMIMDIEDVHLSGLYTETYSGESTQTVAGYAYETYEIDYFSLLTVTGAIYGYTVTGTATLDGVTSYDQDSLDVVVDDYTLSMDLEVTVLGIPVSMEFSEHNVSKVSPPGGVGAEPEDPDKGDSWTKTYTIHSESTFNDDGDISTESSSFTLIETCTYLGMQTVTVPAGTFECRVIQMDDGDDIETYWCCGDTGRHVKNVYEASSSESGSLLLKAYTYTPPSSGLLSDAMMLLVFGVGIAAVVVVVVLWVILRKRSPPKGQAVSSTSPIPGPPFPPPPTEPPQGVQ